MVANIVISEVNLIKDYIKLKNTSTIQVNLKNWKLIDTTPTNKNRHKFIFKKDFWLAPDSAVKTWSGVGNGDANNIYQNRKAKIWNNLGDTAELYDSAGSLVDSKTVGKPPTNGRGPVPPKPPTKITMSGFVNDNVCKQGVKARLVFESLKAQEKVETNSDENGHYKTELTTGRDYTVTVSAKNYDDLPDTVNTKAGKDITKNFKLRPNFEIELRIDSTNVKFTRRDDNKINVTQELKNKIIVDFNSDYTFAIKLSIKKGMTNKIKAILVENSTTNKDSRESNVCRINDDYKTLTFTFNKIKQKWDWVVLGAFWYVDAEKTKANMEKIYKYALELSGSYDNNVFSPDNPSELGEIVVRVNEEKLAYLIKYDLLIGDLWRAIETTVAAALIPGLEILAAAAAAIVIILIEQKNAALDSAKDPPQFDKNYEKLVKRKLNLKTHDVSKRAKQLSLILDSVMLSRDRLYSAHVKQDKKLARRHFYNTKKLLDAYIDNAKFLSTKIKSATKTIKNYKNYIDVEAVRQFRDSMRKKVLPRASIMNAIKSLGLSEKDAQIVLRVFMSKKFADEDLSLASHLDRLPKLVDNFNKFLVKNFKKEIECYKQIKE